MPDARYRMPDTLQDTRWYISTVVGQSQGECMSQFNHNQSTTVVFGVGSLHPASGILEPLCVWIYYLVH